MIEWRSDITEHDSPQPADLAEPAPPRTAKAPTLCVVCGYDLKGLDPNAHCPECAAKIVRTTAREYASFSSDEQIKRISTLLLLIPIVALPLLASAAVTVFWVLDRSRLSNMSKRIFVSSILALGLSLAAWHLLWFVFVLVVKPRIEVIEPRGDSFRFVRKMTLALLATEFIAALILTLWLAGMTGSVRFAATVIPATFYTRYWFAPIVFGAYLIQIPALFLQADILGRFSHGLPYPEKFDRSRRDAAAAKPLALFSVVPVFGIVLQMGAIVALMLSAWRARRVLRTLDLGV